MKSESGIRILIAEDELSSRRLLVKMLEEFGSVDIAVNGKEALEAVRLGWSQNEPYQLLCLDLKMPEIDGSDVLPLLRQEEQARGMTGSKVVKVVMTTGVDDSKTILGSFREGADGYLVKPVNRQKLSELLLKLFPQKDS